CDRQVLRRSCCSSATNQPGLKGVEIQKEASAHCLTSVEMFLPEFLWGIMSPAMFR
ncbi:hypothetical protein CRENBAI_008010, partial [Crenichthys baileyi]